MQNELLTPESISKENLKAALDAAFIDASFDSDGDLVIKDDVRCFVFIHEKKDAIRLYSRFGIKENTPDLQQLQLANDINIQYRIIRAYVPPERLTLCLDFEILLNGGITMKNFIMAVKRFCSIPRDAIRDLDKDNIIE